MVLFSSTPVCRQHKHFFMLRSVWRLGSFTSSPRIPSQPHQIVPKQLALRSSPLRPLFSLTVFISQCS